jgi:hypothetical protein
MKKISILFVLGFLALSFNGFSQLFINSSGYVGINQSAPSYNLDWYGTGRFWGSGWGMFLFNNAGSSNVVTMHPGEDWVGCLGTSTKRFNYVWTYNINTQNVNTWSDEKLKENIKPLVSSLDKIRQLRGVSYGMKQDFFKVDNPGLQKKLADESKNEIGFIAQEVKAIFPELVTQDSTTQLYSVNYTKLIPVLVEAIKEQQVQIEELKRKIK